MPLVRACDFPDDLYYNVEHNVWAKPEPDGSLTVGMTAYGCALAGEIVSCLAKKPGKEIELNKSLATVESGKWVGPVKSPARGEILAVNEALETNPGLMNEDPYGTGWVLRLKPLDWETDCRALLTGGAVAAAFEEKMDAEGFAGC